MGLSMDSSNNVVPSPTFSGRKALVGDQETSGQVLSTNTNRPVTGIDWTAVFAVHPELSPPGYEEAVEATLKSVEQRKLLKKQSQEEKKTKRSTGKRK